jgi:hypothetical protein
LYQIKKLCTARETIIRGGDGQENGRQPLPGFIWQGTISKIYKEVEKLHMKKINNPIDKWANKLNRVLKRRSTNVNIYMKKCSTSLSKRKCKAKLHWDSISPRSQNGDHQENKNKSWQNCYQIGRLIHYRWECKLVQPLWKSVWRFLKNIKIELPYNSVNPTHTSKGM